MTINEIMYQSVGPFYCGPGGGGESNWAPWTLDWDLAPSSVYAVASISTYASRQSGGAGASAGILSYVTKHPRTGVLSQHVLSSQPLALQEGSWPGSENWDLEEGLLPCFFDNNVVTITFAYNAWADDWVTGMASFTGFIFE